jgi:dTDP-4-amino-4,6-dideoxygalactose transaminase
MEVPYVDTPGQHHPLRKELLEATGHVLDHGKFILGPEVEEFERRFAALAGTRFAVGVGNGTDALILVLRALGIGVGDEVITAPNSFLASTSCIALVGARPVFIDVCSDFTLDPDLLESAITPRTRAILPIHLTGLPADMDAILSVAERHHLAVIEDAAQAVGARYRGKPVGSLGIAGCFSFHPLKNLSACGDAGIITTNDATLYERLVKARNHGLRDRDHAAFWSVNSRLDTLQAALLLAKLPHLAEWTRQRREHAAFYRQHLQDVVEVPSAIPDREAVYHTFVSQTDRRDTLKAFLAEHGVGTAVHYPVPIHLQEAAKDLGYKVGDFPSTERQAKRILSLPVYPHLRADQRTYVVECIREFFGKP